MNQYISSVSAVIANGAAVTGKIDLKQSRAARIMMPAAWTAANLTVDITNDDGVTWNPLYKDDGTEYTITAAAGRSILLNIADFLSIRMFRLRSGPVASPVNQGAQRAITILTVPA